MSKLTRRDVLQAAAAGVVGTAGVGTSKTVTAGESSVENGLYTRRPIEIYTSTLSAAAGEKVALHVSTTVKRFDIQIARVGVPERVVWTKENLPGKLHATPDEAWEKGCGWPASVSIEIPREWRSGFYQISAVAEDKGTQTIAHAFFVVRASRPTAKILLVHPTATYGAYNTYGSASLYVQRNNVRKGGFVGGERRVSFLRPWMPGFIWKSKDYDFDAEFEDLKAWDVDERDINRKSGIATFANVAGFHNWDRVLINWLEKNGYDIDYAISSDLDLHPELLGRYRLMLSVGHDEYWSWGMRDSVESFVAQGGNVCFLSGNVAWQIRHEDNGSTVVCYKDAMEEDPVFKAGKKHLTTTLWSSPVVGRPETSLTGLSYAYGGYSGWLGASPQGPKGFTVYRPEHWVFKDTGLVFGDCLGSASKVVHFEVDGCPIRMEDGLPYPAKDYDGPSSLEIIGLCAVAYPGSGGDSEVAKRLLGNTKAYQALARNRGHAVMGLFTNKGTVFSAGTTDWTNGLTGKDPAVEQVTRNLLNRLSDFR